MSTKIVKTDQQPDDRSVWVEYNSNHVPTGIVLDYEYDFDGEYSLGEIISDDTSKTYRKLELKGNTSKAH